jgi:hypothetical protein
MTARLALWSMALLEWCTAGSALASELPDYVRYREDARTARLEVAIRRFTMPSGQKVDLVGVVHIADHAYYQQLNERFETYDSVLYELVGDPARLTRVAPLPETAPSGGVSFIQQSAGKHLGLAFQLDAIDYTRKNLVHADTSAEEFARLQYERGENMLTLFGRAMKAQLVRDLHPSTRSSFDSFALLRILMSPDSALAFKKELARSLDQMEASTALMEGQDGSVILGARNAVAIAKLKEVLANRRQRHVAVFFGGAHMPGIERALVTDLNAVISGEEWLAAWTMKPREDKNPAPGTATPAS